MILNYHHRQADTHQMPHWVRVLFLQWIPWILRMSRPGEKITRKTILMETKLKELDIKENSSKSLLANVLDMDDDFQQVPNFPCNHIYPQVGSTAKPTKNGEFLRVSVNPPHYEDNIAHSGVHRELLNILKEIRVIADKVRNDDEAARVENDWKF